MVKRGRVSKGYIKSVKFLWKETQENHNRKVRIFLTDLHWSTVRVFEPQTVTRTTEGPGPEPSVGQDREAQGTLSMQGDRDRPRRPG